MREVRQVSTNESPPRNASEDNMCATSAGSTDAHLRSRAVGVLPVSGGMPRRRPGPISCPRLLLPRCHAQRVCTKRSYQTAKREWSPGFAPFRLDQQHIATIPSAMRMSMLSHTHTHTHVSQLRVYASHA